MQARRKAGQMGWRTGGIQDWSDVGSVSDPDPYQVQDPDSRIFWILIRMRNMDLDPGA